MKNSDSENIAPLPDYVKNWGDFFNTDSPDEEYEIVVNFAPNTCPGCGEMDGSHFLLAKREIGKNFPPFHNGCNCSGVF